MEVPHLDKVDNWQYAPFVTLKRDLFITHAVGHFNVLGIPLLNVALTTSMLGSQLARTYFSTPSSFILYSFLFFKERK